MQFFNDNQIRRYLLQFNRIFSSIQYEYSNDGDDSIIRTVPVISGSLQRDVAQILSGASQNATFPIPCFSSYITDLTLAPERRANPTHESSLQLTERKYTESGYNSEAGRKVTIDRYMPVPYNLSITLDLITSNTNTKLQILEQILCIFNPSLQLQSNDNYADWTNIFEVELANINWSSQTIPIGTDTSRDICTMEFNVPIWINPPAKIKQQKLIENIVYNIRSIDEINDFGDNSEMVNDPKYGQYVVTFNNYSVYWGMDGYKDNELVLLPNDSDKDPNWKSVLKKYGRVVPGITTIRLNSNGFEKVDDDIIALVDYSDKDDALVMTIDESTLPSPTVGDILNIVDPNLNFPDVDLPSPKAGDRYMFMSSLSSGEEPAISDMNKYWGLSNVPNGGIVEYNGSEWIEIFSSSNRIEFVYNIDEDVLLKYIDGQWEYAYHGLYKAGFWRLEAIQGLDEGINYVNQC